MTTVAEARRRTTDEILSSAMEESGNHDPSKVASTGQKMHYDAFDDLASHREALHPTKGESVLHVVEVGAGKLIGFGIDKAADKALEHFAAGFLVRAGVGGGSVILGIAGVAYETYTEGYEKPHREGDRQMKIAASDAGVAGLTHVLPFDPSFKSAVVRAHGGSAGAAASVAATLGKPEHAAELDELKIRSEKGFLDALPLARAAAHEIAARVTEGRTALDEAKAARARGDTAGASKLEDRATTAFERAAELQKNAMTSITSSAHADAAYGLGVQYAFHKALRVELGKENAGELTATEKKSREDVDRCAPQQITVRG